MLSGRPHGARPRVRRGFTLAEVIVSLVILAIGAGVIVQSMAAQDNQRRVEETRETLFSLGQSLNNPHDSTTASTYTVDHKGFLQKVLKYPRRLHALNTKIIISAAELSCSGGQWAAADTVAWNGAGAAPGTGGQWPPYSGLNIVSGKGVSTPLGWVHDSVVKGAIAGWLELHIDSLSITDAQNLDIAVDGSSTPATGLVRYAASGSYQLVRYLISAPLNGAVTRGC